MRRKVKLIIPAAGAGKRMDLPYPKTLFPVAGVPILGHILKAALPVADEGVVVVSPEGKPLVEEFIVSARLKGIRLAIQEKPIGMADAVEVGARAHAVEKCDFLIIWGDQVTAQTRTLQKLKSHHLQNSAWLSLPTTIRRNPYVHVVRDSAGKVIGMLEAREGDLMPEWGESDCGVFMVRGEHLLNGIAELRMATYNPRTGRYDRLDGSPSITGEFNFLPLISLWGHMGIKLAAVPAAESDESVGVNTRADAEFVESRLNEKVGKR